MAIAEKLQAKVNGLDQGQQAIQDANNALNVADGAMQTISTILQRMRELVVQANSDLKTANDEANIQTELDQLKLEVGRIVQNTTFNGQNLLDGSLSSQIPQQGRVFIAQNDGLSAGSGTLIDTTLDPATPAPGQPSVNVTQLLQVLSYDPASDTLTVRSKLFSTDPGFGPTQDQTFQVANGTNYPVGGFPPTPGNPLVVQSTQNGTGTPVLSFNIGVLTAADVGKAAIVGILDPETKAPGQAAEINTGDAEGSVIQVDIPALSTINLGINTVQLGDKDQNTIDEYKIDYGIQHLANIRAQVGAETVALQESGNVAAVTGVNTQASESQIRDVNVGAEVTAFTKNQILVQLQTAVLSKLYGAAPSVLALVQNA